MQYSATIEPNEKYRAVINGETDFDYEDEADYREQHPAPEAADAYIEAIDTGYVPDDTEDARDEPLSWSHFSVSSDADLVAKMATYFDGVEPDEPTDLIRAKLRLIHEPEVYVNAQIAAQAEIRRGLEAITHDASGDTLTVNIDDTSDG